MPSPRVSLQLWSLRDQTALDFAATVNQVAKIGFAGVESAGFGNLEAPEAATAIKGAELIVSGGLDPAQVIREYGRRIQLLQIKDEAEIGSGPVNFAPIFDTADNIGSIEWYILEIEKYNHDPIESARLSFEQMRAWRKV